MQDSINTLLKQKCYGYTLGYTYHKCNMTPKV